MLSPVPAATRSAGPLADDLAGLGHPRHHGRPVAVGVDDRQHVPAVLALCRRPVASARSVATIGHQLAAGQLVRSASRAAAPRVPSAASARVRSGAATTAWSTSSTATGTLPTVWAHSASPPGKLLDQPPGVWRRLGVVPQLGRSDHLPVGVEHDHAVLLTGDADGRDVWRSGRRPRLLEGGPPRRGILLAARRGRRRMRRAGSGDHVSGGDVADLDLGALGRRIDACDQLPRGHGGVGSELMADILPDSARRVPDDAVDLVLEPLLACPRPAAGPSRRRLPRRPASPGRRVPSRMRCPDSPDQPRVTRVTSPFEDAVIDQLSGDQQRPGEGVDAPDVAVEQIVAVHALTPQLGVEVEPA